MTILGGDSILQDGLMLAILLSAMPLGAVIVVGVVSSVLQAVTSIQEQTLSFVPKLCAVFAVLWFFAPWMWTQIQTLFVTAVSANQLVL